MYNKLIMPIIIGLVVMTTSVTADETVDRSLSVSSNGVVQIANVRGIVRVEGWNNDEVSVKGRLDEATESFKFETSGNVTSIEVKLPKGRTKRGDGSNLIIRVPHDSQVEFGGVSSDFVIERVRGGIDVRTVSGDVDAIEIQEKVFINSVSGDVTVDDSSGDSKLTSVSGDIKAKIDSQSIDTSSTSGDITLHLQSFENLEMSTVSGDIWMKGQQLPGSEIGGSTVSGDITLNFVDGCNARVNIKTGPGGDIRNSVSSDAVEEVFPSQERLRASIGTGDGKISLNTVSGTIKLNES